MAKGRQKLPAGILDVVVSYAGVRRRPPPSLCGGRLRRRARRRARRGLRSLSLPHSPLQLGDEEDRLLPSAQIDARAQPFHVGPSRRREETLPLFDEGQRRHGLLVDPHEVSQKDGLGLAPAESQQAPGVGGEVLLEDRCPEGHVVHVFLFTLSLYFAAHHTGRTR